MSIMKVQNVIFEYPGVRALNGVSLNIRRQRITALVGPNGAGKSTLLRILAVLQPPLSGTVSMDDRNVFAAPREAHRNIGFLPDFFGLYDQLTVEQCLRYFAMAHKVEESNVFHAIQETAALLQLQDRLQQRAGELSRGLRQRLAIAQAIIHRPPLLLLDEPASGLDPEARHSLAELFLRLRDEGMSLLVSSHILSELDTYCDEMIVLRNGNIVECSPRQDDQVVLCLRLLKAGEAVQQALTYLEQQPELTGLSHEGTSIEFYYSTDVTKQHQLLQSLMEKQFPVVAFSARERSLQEAYLATR